MRTTPTTNVICVRSSQFITIAETSGPPQRPHMPQNRPQWAETTLIGKFSRSWTRVGTLFDRFDGASFARFWNIKFLPFHIFCWSFALLWNQMGANFFFFCFSVTQNGCSRMRWKPVLAQFLGGPLLPHLLQTPEISQLLFVPAASPLTIRKLFLRILCLYYSSSAILLPGLPCSWRPKPKRPRRTRRARGRKTDLPFF